MRDSRNNATPPTTSPATHALQIEPPPRAALSDDVLERMSEGFFTLDVALRFTYLNIAAAQLLGRSRDELLGQVLWEAFPEAVGSAFARKYEHAAASGEAFADVAYYMRSDRWFDIRGYPSAQGALSVYIQDVTERERARLETEAAALRFRRLVDANVTGVVTGEGDYFVEANEAFLRMLGYPREALAARQLTWRSITPPGHEDADERSLNELKTRGAAQPFEKEYLRADGTRVPVLVVVALLDPAALFDPTTFGWMAFIVDLSEQKRLEREQKRLRRELRTQTAELRRLQETAGVGLTRCSRDLRYVSANAAYAEIVGVPVDELIGKSLVDIVGEPGFALVRPYIERVLRGERVEYELDIPYSTGSMRSVHVVQAPDEDDAGVVVGWVASVTDITRRKQMERSLAESEQRFRGTFENAAVGMAHIAPDGRWLHMNERLCEILGYARDELLARTWQDVTYPEDLDADLEYVRQVLAGERERYTMEKRYIRSDGAIVWGQLTVALQRDSVGAPQYFISVVEDITAHKWAEEALQASEERLRLALDASASGAFIWYPDEDRTASDARMLALFGLPPDGLLNLAEALARLIHPDDRAPYAAAVAQALDPQGSGELREDIRVLLPDGTQRWLAITGRAAFEGTPPTARHLAGTAVDITERKDLERAVEEHAERLHSIFETITDPIFVYDATGAIVDANAAARRQLSAPLEEFNAQSREGRNAPYAPRDEHSQPLAPQDWPIARILRGETLTGSTAVDMLARLPDGRERHLNVAGAPIRDGSGRITGAVGVTRDVTERRLLEQRLVEANTGLTQAKELAEERAREVAVILDAMGDGVILMGPDGEVVRMNPAFGRLLDLADLPEGRASYTGASVGARGALLRLADPSGRRLSAEEFPATRILRGETFIGSQAQEIRLTTLTGREVVISVSGVPLERTSGQPSGGVLVLRDVTERYDRDRERAQMLSVVAHELNTPLTTVKAMIQINQRRAARGMALTPEQLDPEAKAVARMERLIRDLLEAARAESDHLELHRAPTDLVALCEQVASEQMTVSGRAITLDLTPEPVVADVDGERIVQVVGNLLSNALKYSPTEAQVTVRLRTQGREAVLAVSDNGPGIPAESAPRLFERFYRAPGSTVLHGTGVGLGVGLYLCKQFVERHGGTISVESQLGRGSTFIVQLPIGIHDHL